MAQEDIYKTTFRTHNDHYKFMMMPSDLTNTSVTFKSIMNEFFRIHLKRFILAYFFYDILVYS
jgi:hypothetical protein